MTFQTSERFLYQGKQLFSNDQPLALHPHAPEFVSVMTMCRRGYNGSWQIEDNKLYLTELDANIKHPTRLKKRRVRRLNEKWLELEHDHDHDSEPIFIYKEVLVPLVIKVKLLDVFPEAINGQLFADWFSGEINFDQGEVVNEGMITTYERYLTLNFEKGILVNERNRTHEEVYPTKTTEELIASFQQSARASK